MTIFRLSSAMVGSGNLLKEQLHAAGLSRAVIDAAWPDWWSDAADSSVSAKTELRLAVARNLGLSPRSLVAERVEFVWHDRARFKHLRANEEIPRAILNSFGVSLGRSLVEATHPNGSLLGIAAADIRESLMHSGVPDLAGLLSLCWALGTPVVHLRVWPLATKAMQAMVIGQHRRHAILLCREAKYSALLAFTLAHEIGHIALGHVPETDVLVDAEQSAGVSEKDHEEKAADRYALEVLLGDPDPDIKINSERFNAPELAAAVLRAGPEYGIDPGALALAVAYRRNAWPIAMAAMRFIEPKPVQLSALMNQIAKEQLDLDRLGSDNLVFVRRALGINDD